MRNAAHNHIIHGLGVVSEIELGLEPAPPAPTDLRIERASIGDAPQPLPSHRRVDNETDPGVVETWRSDVLTVDFPDEARFEVDSEVIRVVTSSIDEVDLAHYVLDHILPRALSLRGDIVFHGSAVVGPSGRAHAFIGPSGSGKSTLAAALVQSGWALLHDDIVRLALSETLPIAYPGYSQVRLIPSTAARLFSDSQPLLPLTTRQKQRYPIAPPLVMSPGPADVCALHLLESRDNESGSTVVEGLSLTQAFPRLARNAYLMTKNPKALARVAIEGVGAVVESVPVYTLNRPVGLEYLGRTVAALTEFDAASGG